MFKLTFRSITQAVLPHRLHDMALKYGHTNHLYLYMFKKKKAQQDKTEQQKPSALYVSKLIRRC